MCKKHDSYKFIFHLLLQFQPYLHNRQLMWHWLILWVQGGKENKQQTTGRAIFLLFWSLKQAWCYCSGADCNTTTSTTCYGPFIYIYYFIHHLLKPLLIDIIDTRVFWTFLLAYHCVKYNKFYVPPKFFLKWNRWKFEGPADSGDKLYDGVYWQMYVAHVFLQLSKFYASLYFIFFIKAAYQ